MSREYDHPYEYEIPLPDELATCIALIVGAKIRAEKHISNPWGLSQLTDTDQALMDTASDALDTAVQALEAVRQAIAKPPSP
ncbi:hypothetical protein QUA27_25640 [Microcoleus sp. Pol14C6]|uniref:hypothetical protein n=1 Tax=unclassified Microcoleus TaxID=2642155 RepID=UPI002FD3709C